MTSENKKLGFSRHQRNLTTISQVNQTENYSNQLHLPLTVSNKFGMKYGMMHHRQKSGVVLMNNMRVNPYYSKQHNAIKFTSNNQTNENRLEQRIIQSIRDFRTIDKNKSNLQDLSSQFYSYDQDIYIHYFFVFIPLINLYIYMNQDLKLSYLFQNQDENIETQPTPPTSNQFNQNLHTKNKSQSSLFYQRDKNNNLYNLQSSKPNGQLSQKFQSQLKIQQNAKFDKIQLQRFKLDRKLYPRLIDIDSQQATFIPLQTNSFHNGFQQNSVMKLSDFKTNINSEGILNTPSPVRFDQAKIQQKTFQFYSPQQRDITKMEQLPFYQHLPSSQSTSHSQQNLELLQHRVPHLSLKAIGLKKHLKQQTKQRNVQDFVALNLPKLNTSQMLTQLLIEQSGYNKNSRIKHQTHQPLIKVIVQQNLQFKENKKQVPAQSILSTQEISSNQQQLIHNKNDNTTSIQGSLQIRQQDLSSLTNKPGNKQVSSKMGKHRIKQEQTLSALSSKMKLSELFEEENIQEKRQRFIVIEESFGNNDTKSLINYGNIIFTQKNLNSKFILGIQIY